MSDRDHLVSLSHWLFFHPNGPIINYGEPTTHPSTMELGNRKWLGAKSLKSFVTLVNLPKNFFSQSELGVLKTDSDVPRTLRRKDCLRVHYNYGVQTPWCVTDTDILANSQVKIFMSFRYIISPESTKSTIV